MIYDTTISEMLDVFKVESGYTQLDWKKSNIVLEQWKRCFASGSILAHGKWVHNQFFWHAFSHGEAPSSKGAKAEHLYSEMHMNTCSGYYIMLHEGNTAILNMENHNIPALESIQLCQKDILGLADLHIFDKAFDWTFVMTHEEDIGPFFARDNSDR